MGAMVTVFCYLVSLKVTLESVSNSEAILLKAFSNFLKVNVALLVINISATLDYFLSLLGSIHLCFSDLL